MKTLFSTILIVTVFFVANLHAGNISTNNPEKATQVEIDNALEELTLIDQFVEKENVNFQSLVKKNPELLKEKLLAPEISEDEFFAKGNDRPLGIPGFLWGFCFGVIGMLVVYLTMDEGEERKKEVKNALYGCIAGTLIGYLFYALIIAATVSNDPVILETFNIV